MKRRSLLAMLTLAAGLAVASSPVLADDLYSTIMARKSIRVAVPTDYPPYGSVGSDMTPRGYDIDMAQLIGKKLGVKVELVPVTAPNRIAYLQTNKADITISSVGKTAERAKVVDFSIAYAPFFSAVYSPKGIDDGVKSLADLSGKTVGAARGTIEEQALTATVPKDTTIKRFEDNNATISAYVSGQVDLVATGNTVAAVIAKQNPARAPVMRFLIKDSPCYVGLNKDEPKLLAKVNDIIAKAKAAGELEKLSEKWLKQPLPPGF